GADQHRLGDATGAVARDVADDLAATRRVPDVDGVLQVERFDERREVVGVRIEVVAVPGLARATVAAAVGRDAPVAARSEEEHLVLERVRAERPAVAEDDGLTGSPVVVVDGRTVLGRDRAHRCPPLDRSKQRSYPRADPYPTSFEPAACRNVD